ncbi:F-box only protein 11-like [Rhopilema esculentum]|uniref:F-box only protein 11-like n=1 Tax=Rhopilema esculentum TaxID=499914 RepID=UPI0031D48489
MPRCLPVFSSSARTTYVMSTARRRNNVAVKEKRPIRIPRASLLCKESSGPGNGKRPRIDIKQEMADETTICSNITKVRGSRRKHIPPGYFQRMLPDEVLLKVCSFCPPVELSRLSMTCKRLNALCRDDSLWKTLYWRVYRMRQPLLRGCSGLYEIADKNRFLGLTWRGSFPLLSNACHVTKDEKLADDLKYLERKCYSTINDAVGATSPGGIILVHPGSYDEEVTLEQKVSIIGTENPETQAYPTVSCSTGTLFRIRPSATGSSLAYLRLEITAQEGNSQVRGHCVEVCNDCSPTIQDCYITSKNTSSSAIFVHGDGGKPKVARCKVVECENVGIFVTDGAQGTYEDNEIYNNRLAGLWVKGGANPVVRRNSIHHGRDAGLFIFDGGLGYFEENNVYSNRIAGFEIRSGANPTVVRCQIYGGSTGGIYVHDDGRGEFIGNKIHSNTFAGVWITSGSNPTIKDNEIYHGQQGGIYVFGDGRGLIENNDIHGNALAGIQIRSNSNPIVRKNRIHHGLHGGIYVHEGGLGLIEDNEIFSNTLAGVWITTGSSPILRHNRIHSGKQVGVYFYDKGCGTLEDNEIYNHKYSGIQIRSGSNPVIRRNKIWGGKNGGVLIYNGGLGIIEDNEIFDNAMAGVWIKTESNPILRRNKIHDGHEGGICIFNNGKGLLEDNDIFRNSLTGVLISTSSFPVLRRNRIFEGGAAGIEITNNAGGVLEKNEIFNNRFDGVSLATGVLPKMIENFIHDNKKVLTEAINTGKCLYQVSGSLCYPMHDFYKCLTCSSTESLAICVNCIRTCHEGHEVEFVRHDRFFCDCGAGTTTTSCRLTNKQVISSPAKARSSRSPRTQRARQKRTGGRCLRNSRGKGAKNLPESVSETLVR